LENLKNCRSEIEGLSQYKDLLTLLSLETAIGRHLDRHVAHPTGIFRLSAWDYIAFPLAEYVRIQPEKQSPLDDLFETTFQDLLEYFYTNSIGSNYLIPLVNFDCATESLVINSKLKIRRLTEPELDPFKQRWLWPKYTFQYLRFALDLSYTHPKSIYDNMDDALLARGPIQPSAGQTVDNMLSALRLLKTSRITYGIGVVIPTIRAPALGTGIFWSPWANYSPGGPVYSLEAQDLEQLRALYDTIRNIHSPSPLDSALRRFNASYDRHNLQDRFVDLTIALEALFLNKGETSEITHKLALRIARLIGNTFDQRETIQKELKSLYGKRSGIVHGEPIRVDDTHVSSLEGYVRGAITRLLQDRVLDSRSLHNTISHIELD
jgi:hypothetical protein